MAHRPPVPAESAEPSSWLLDQVRQGTGWIAREVGPNFEAYANWLHPVHLYAPDHDGQSWATWGDVARVTGRTLHASMDWDALSGQNADGTPEADTAYADGQPDRGGEVPTWAIEAACSVLARHRLPSNRW